MLALLKAARRSIIQTVLSWRQASRLRVLLRQIALLVTGAIAIALLVAWSGIYNVAASRGHTRLVEWFLQFGMENSVEVRSSATDRPETLDADFIALGAAHYRDGCAYCHGAPGISRPVVARQMLPAPPLLTAVSHRWKDDELHWIVQHGLKYTGMPAWPSQSRSDEVWAVVAFLKALPNMSGAEYERLAGDPLPAGTPRAAALCGRCHGDSATRPLSKLVPIIHAQPREMIVRALEEYRSGLRESGIMQPIAQDLSDDQIDEFARYYASLPFVPIRDAPSAKSDLGRLLAHEGSSKDQIPPCLLCHGPEAAPSYPRLAGQSSTYMANQLRLWKDENFRHSGHAKIMMPIARRLTEQQIEDLSAYLSSMFAGNAPK